MTVNPVPAVTATVPAPAEPTDPNAEYFAQLGEQSLVALWTTPEARPEPRPAEVPHVWHWRDVYPLLSKGAEVMDLSADAQRRALTFRNPGRGPSICHTLNAALQLVMPGEAAPAHRHTMAALRFVIDAEGGYTVVDGEKIPMHNGDLILTPGWTWHDHKNDNTDRPMVWFDGLDAAFVRSMQAVFYEDYAGNVCQPILKSDDDSPNRFGAAGMLPPRGRPTSRYSPLNVYPWQTASEGLRRLRAIEEDPFDAAILEYVNPITGGHVLPTIACYLQSLRPGQHTRAHRQTSSGVYLVVRGSGSSIVNGKRLDWQERDVFVIPTWAWHEHLAGDGEVTLFSMSDLPMLEPFGLYREQAFEPNGGHQEITA
jgi:gentisate 1,2-dioxygenase